MAQIQDIMNKIDLSGEDLSGFSLGTRDLRGKILRGADLSHAHLGGADLSGADLRNAILYKANLGSAKLIGADLRYSDIREANLAGADMTGADLREAVGLDLDAPIPLADIVKPVTFIETEDFRQAKEAGFQPLAHWGRAYANPDGHTLYKDRNTWLQIKQQLGDVIFGDRRTFKEVRLVRQYKEYSQWAYMISKRGFERIVHQMGLRLQKKKSTSP